MIFVTGYALSWYEAQSECASRGGYLASLNTPQELHDVVHVLSMRRHGAAIFLGLKYPDHTLPHMYVIS